MTFAGVCRFYLLKEMDPLDLFLLNQRRFIVITTLRVKDVSQTLRVVFYEPPSPDQKRLIERLSDIDGVSQFPTSDIKDLQFGVSTTLDVFGLGRAIAETLHQCGSNVKLFSGDAEDRTKPTILLAEEKIDGVN